MSEGSRPPTPQGGFLAGLVEDVSQLSGPPLAAVLAEAEEGSSDGESFHDPNDYDQVDLSGLSDLLQLETNLRAAAHAEVEKALQKWLSPQRVLMRDKLVMVFFTLHIVLGAYWLGCSPRTFYRLYTAEGALLLALRFAHYRWTKQHYYLLDWCYLANALLIFHVWYMPTSVLLAKVMFAHSMGPLLWSIVAFRNSLVYHSLDKMTSHFMHFYPACVCWTIRWHTAPDSALGRHLATHPQAAAAWEAASVRDLLLFPMLPYLLWAVLYYVKVFVISARKVQQRGYDTLFKYSIQNRRSLFGAVVLRFRPALQPLVYSGMHLLLTLTTMSLNLITWRSYYACTAFLLVIFTCSAYSGATFMFDVFSLRYPHPKRQRPRDSSATPSVQQEVSTAGTGGRKKHV